MHTSEPRPSSTERIEARPAGTVRLAAPATRGGSDADWIRPAKDYASTRFSGLDEITVANVGRLRPVWTFSTGALGGHEAAPLVVGRTMYIVAPFPNTVFALDLAQPGAPQRWRYDPRPLAASKGLACCDAVNRGAVYDAGTIFFNTLDGRTIALDAESGRERWVTQLGDLARGETMTMAPLVVRGKVLVGNSGGELGVRGWLAALDASSGRVAWKAYSTGPDEDVRIGPEFHPFYPSDRGTNLGSTTWPGDAWKRGGGAVWGWLSYDPDLDLVYYGTSNPSPWNAGLRPGDNKWTSGVFARSPETGAARWFYQTSPHDLFDYDSINESILLDLDVDGRRRKVLVRPERNGYVYVMDRTSGEVLSATPFVHITTSRGVDLESGRLQLADEKKPVQGVVIRDICPAAPGAKDWQPSSFSPVTGYLYIPHNNLCMSWESVDTGYIAGTPYTGANVVYEAGPGGHLGAVTAWDVAAAKPAWTIREPQLTWSGTLATAGHVVFYGTLDGWFKAVDARTGAALWQFKTSSGIVGQPVTYRGPDGRQYVAILSGVGGWPGAIVVNDLDTRDATAGNGWGRVLSHLKDLTTKGGTLHVFGLESP